MEFVDLVNEVIEETKRPDLRTRIAQQVRSSTQAVHLSERWPRDLVIEQIVFTSPAYKVDIQLSDLTRFRKVDAAYPVIDGVANQDIQLVEVDVFSRRDGAGNLIDNYYYVVGDKLVLGFDYPYAAAELVYLRNPDCLGTTYSSWIAEEYPFFIVYHAAATILQRVGARELAAKCQEQASEEFRLLQRNII